MESSLIMDAISIIINDKDFNGTHFSLWVNLFSLKNLRFNLSTGYGESQQTWYLEDDLRTLNGHLRKN